MDSEEGMLDLLVQEANAQGFKAWTTSQGTRVFNMGSDTIIICPFVPHTIEQWRRLLTDLTQAGLRWPGRHRPQ